MNIPKMPIFKKPEKHQIKAALNRQIRQLICRLHDILPKAADKDLMARHLGIVFPGKDVDVTRLFVNTEDGTSKESGLTPCLFAKVNYLILCFWDYALNHDNPSAVKKVIADLEHIAMKGLNNCKVGGNVKDGFRLEVK